MLPDEEQFSEGLVNAGYLRKPATAYFEKLEGLSPGEASVLEGLGGRVLASGLWDRISGMEREKGIIENRVVLPLAHPERAAAHGVLPPHAIRQALDYLAGRHPLLAHRVAERRIVDGHGDLLAEDIFCPDDGPRILDCVEFDPRFRWGDVLYDTTFLAMDLEHLGRADLARRFLAAYREYAGENHPESLEHWYIAYRALVRAKIACLRAVTGEPGAAKEAAAFLAQAGRHLDEAEIHLVLVGGLPGTGKTTLAQGLADRLGWAVLRSDEVRKELAALDPTESAGAAPFEGIYTPAFTAEVYRELLHRAKLALGWGDCVVLDATWLDPQQRDAARRLARQGHAHLHEIRCELTVEEAAARIFARAAAGGDVSDATPAVLAALAKQAQVSWTAARHIDTSRPETNVIDHAISLVRPDRSPGGPAGGGVGEA